MNNRIEQDHRRIKRRTRSMLGFKSTATAKAILGGIELIHMIRKGQMFGADGRNPSLAERLDSLAAESTMSNNRFHVVPKFATEPTATSREQDSDVLDRL